MSIPPSGRQYEIRYGDHVAVVVEVGGGVREYRVGDRAVSPTWRATMPAGRGYAWTGRTAGVPSCGWIAVTRSSNCSPVTRCPRIAAVRGWALSR
jgi:hypothetical protein